MLKFPSGVLLWCLCRVYIYNEGLVRFCTERYSRPAAANLACSYMHLTNYAVNKHNTGAYSTTTTAATGGTGSMESTALAATANAPAYGVGLDPVRVNEAPACSAGTAASACSSTTRVHSASSRCGGSSSSNQSSCCSLRSHPGNGVGCYTSSSGHHGGGDSSNNSSDRTTGVGTACGSSGSGGGVGGDSGIRDLSSSKWSFQQLRDHLERQGEKGVGWLCVLKR